MSSYSSAAANYASGSIYTMSWTTPEVALNLSDNGVVAWARFTGATALLAGTVSAASVTITGIGAPGTSESFTIKGDKTIANAGLPVGYMDASSRTLTSASANTGDLSAVTTLSNFDITAIIQELVSAIDGDEVLLKFEDTTYAGSGITGMSVTLSVTYTGGGASGPSMLLLNLLDQNA